MVLVRVTAWDWFKVWALWLLAEWFLLAGFGASFLGVLVPLQVFMTVIFFVRPFFRWLETPDPVVWRPDT